MVDSITNSVLAPLQNSGAAPSQAAAPTPYEVTNSFASYLTGAIQDINTQQTAADKMNQGLLTGQVQDMSQVMIASQKAALSLDLAVQIRNKAIDAYQEIMRMQI
ncbi:flagellar hook-basal body complex protein FliE [Aneurinibacillus sp. Ricciae_BoGa-3]|uniref:flagellar hook-basal body complex protein FliE n=1 Tax=Aneurinibacillus sp. Ricciae_BoGa-3 TaxID=3022697 RepID=UPI0023410BE2|nr:flagellar hook-basal body complex protein FliE [Aneurinibacillus sp. Ricciae_BoGa-3]WCK52902.1 flagellar hook-basal body complex protein FliE [Aneurinibacillus sp. Ricciae_BoGa-3]